MYIYICETNLITSAIFIILYPVVKLYESSRDAAMVNLPKRSWTGLPAEHSDMLVSLS